MADDTPDKIYFAIGSNYARSMVRLADGTYADRTAPAFGGGLVTEVTGQVTFDVNSLPAKRVLDADGNMVQITCGPDSKGRFVRQTYTWLDGNQVSDSAWFMVDGADAP